MKCFHPITIDLSGTEAYWHYKSPLIKVPCGKCAACIKNKRNEWVFRLTKMQECASTSYFVTLTYDDEHLVRTDNDMFLNPTLVPEHVEEFMHKLINKGQSIWTNEQKVTGMPYKERRKNRLKIKYFLVGEYGDKFDRPHYHFVIFDFPGDRECITHCCQDLWQKQSTIIDVRYASGALINYLTKYMIKDTDVDYESLRVHPPFRRMSKGLGLNHVTLANAKRYFSRDKFVDKIGNAYYGLPRYMKEKMEKMYFKHLHGVWENDKEFYYSLHALRYERSQFITEQVNDRKRFPQFYDVDIMSDELKEQQLQLHNKVIKDLKTTKKQQL